MISRAVWQRAIHFVSNDAKISLTSRRDEDTVTTLLDDLIDERPPKVHDFGDPLLMAKIQVVRRLQQEAASKTIQAWLDEFLIELASTPIQND